MSLPNESIVTKGALNVLIAQHKQVLANTLVQYLHQYDDTINIIGSPSSLKELQGYLKNQKQIDVAIFETRLPDGPTFELLSGENLYKPVIFTSHTEEDAFKAFKVNGIDYLLEPLQYDEFCVALDKAIGQIGIQRSNGASQFAYKKRFLVKIGDKLKSKNVEDISYIFAEGKTVYIVSRIDNRKYIVEHTLDELEKIYLNPNDFYRINRKFIININSIEEVRTYVNSRLKLITNPQSESDMIVSREKVLDFKNWLNL
jgi:DNA-binding LytR/AlgR family response regulator